MKQHCGGRKFKKKKKKESIFLLSTGLTGFRSSPYLVYIPLASASKVPTGVDVQVVAVSTMWSNFP